jgi:hypothetical protein
MRAARWRGGHGSRLPPRTAGRPRSGRVAPWWIAGCPETLNAGRGRRPRSSERRVLTRARRPGRGLAERRGGTFVS